MFKIKKFKKFVLLLFFITLFTLTLTNSETFKKSVIEALLISGNSIIPCLFPTISIITIMINSNVVFSLNKKILPVFLFIISQVSGYPVGAKILNSCVDKKIISLNDSEKILPSFICSGPSFVISFVGISIFKSEELGIMIYITLLLTNIILFFLLGGYRIKVENKNTIDKNFNLINTIFLSANSVLNICVLFIFFYSFTNIINLYLPETFRLYINFIFEVTSLVIKSKNIYLTCAALSFGGLCVLLQIKDITVNYRFNYKRLIFFRLFSAILSALILKLCLIIFPIKNFVYSNLNDKISIGFGGNTGYIIVAFLSVIVLLGSLSDKNILKKAKNF